jgi:hypothetical protein
MKKRLIIEKKGTSTTQSFFTGSETDTENESDSYVVDTDFTETEEARRLFKTIAESDYVKPKNGSVQDNFTIDDIKEKLKGFIPLKTMEDKKILTKLPIFRSFVRYINTKTKQFRTGGMLMKVEYPDYMVLVNKGISWSVQLKDNIVFIRDPRIERDQPTPIKKKSEKEQEKIIKDKLYTMFKNGELNGILRK